MLLSRKIVLVTSLLLFVLGFIIQDFSMRFVMFASLILLLATFYLLIFVRVIERACMLKLIDPAKLTEGDWIAKDIIVGKKRIAGPKDLGVSKEQIAQLIAMKKKRKIKQVLIKEGIPFTPSFLLAFLATLAYGNLFLLFF